MLIGVQGMIVLYLILGYIGPRYNGGHTVYTQYGTMSAISL